MKTRERVTLLLFSKNPTLREGFKSLLQEEPGIEIVGETKSTNQVVRQASILNPDFVLMDCGTARRPTLNAIRRIRKSSRRSEIWLCSLWDTTDLATTCMQAGATGFVPKSAGSAALRSVFRRNEGPVSYNRVACPAFRTRNRAVLLMILFALTLRAGAWAQQSSDPRQSQGAEQEDYLAAPTAQDESEVRGMEESPEEEPPRNIQRFYFTTPFSISAARENRLPFEERKVNDFIGVLEIPEMTVADISPRSELLLSYRPEYEVFGRHHSLNAWSHTASLRFSNATSQRWRIRLRDTFRHTEDPTRRFRDATFLLPRSRFQENVLSSTLDYIASARTRYTLGFDNVVSSLSVPNAPSILPVDKFKDIAGVFTASISNVVAPRSRVTGSYSFLLFKDLSKPRDRSVALDRELRKAHSAIVSYERGGDLRGAFLELSAGLLHGSSTSYSAMSRFGYNWPAASVYASYHRQFAVISGLDQFRNSGTRLGSGLFPGSISQVVALDLQGTAARLLVVDLGGSAGWGDAVIRPGRVKSYIGRMRVAYRIGERFFPYIGAEFYAQDFNNIIQARLDRSRYTVGIKIFLDPIRETEVAPSGDVQARWPVGSPGLLPRRAPIPDEKEFE